MRLECPLELVGVDVGADDEVIGHMDPLEDENAPVELDLTDRCRAETAVVSRDISGLQRTAEGTGQSPSGSRDNVVQRR